jgi:uncharacterized membrane protein YfbV (UPF0208 family)
MTSFSHCNKGDYSISDFCEWERKGTLRAAFCTKQLASVSLAYAIGFLAIIAIILGCMAMAFAGGVCQFCVTIALCMLHSVSAIGAIALAGIWTSAKGALPDLTYDNHQTVAWHMQVHDVAGEPGAEWAYVVGSGILEWGISIGVIMTYIAAALAVTCAVCAFYALKHMADTMSIRVEMKQVHVDNDDPSFLDHVATTGVITHTDAVAGITSAGSPPGSPTHLATAVNVGLENVTKEENVETDGGVGTQPVEAPQETTETREEVNAAESLV